MTGSGSCSCSFYQLWCSCRTPDVKDSYRKVGCLKVWLLEPDPYSSVLTDPEQRSWQVSFHVDLYGNISCPGSARERAEGLGAATSSSPKIVKYVFEITWNPRIPARIKLLFVEMEESSFFIVSHHLYPSKFRLFRRIYSAVSPADPLHHPRFYFPLSHNNLAAGGRRLLNFMNW